VKVSQFRLTGERLTVLDAMRGNLSSQLVRITQKQAAKKSIEEGKGQKWERKDLSST